MQRIELRYCKLLFQLQQLVFSLTSSVYFLHQTVTIHDYLRIKC